MRLILKSIGIFLALGSLALGQPPAIERQVNGRSDTNINAGIFFTIRHDCTAGPLPVIRLLTPPTHGKVVMKQGRLRATNLRQCLGTELPAFVAIYRSAANFIGKDVFTIEVIDAAGKAQIQRITVSVGNPIPDRGI